MKLQSEFFDGVIWTPKFIKSKSYGKPSVNTNITGNTAYFYNVETGESKSVFVPNSKISALRKDVADWLKIHGKFRPSGKGVLIPKRDYNTLSRDPLAPFDYSGVSKREGTVTKVLSANRIVIDNNFVVNIAGIQPPKKEIEPIKWENARRFTQELIQGQKVTFAVNLDNPYAQNGDINTRDVEFGQVQTNQQEQGWGAFDYLNVSGFVVGALARNINLLATTGRMGSASVADRYSLSDTFTFTRLYNQLTGTAKTIGGDSKGETEGNWAEKLAIDIVFDPLNFLSIESKGASFMGRRFIKGARYMKPLALTTSRIKRLANTFEGHVAVGGLGKTIDTINRGWRRINMLLEPAYYTANAQLDLWNSMYIGGMKPSALLDESPILAKAKSPMFSNDIVIRPIGKPGLTAKEVTAMLNEFEPVGKAAGYGDVANNPYSKPGLWDKLWAKPVGLAAWQSVKVRRAMFIDGLKKGLNPQEAANRVNHFLLNYDPKSLTAFEQAYINRIFPFYIPQTRNIALQVEQAMRTPYKYTAVAKYQLQQRRFAETDQFKDFDRNMIIQSVGNGKYVKLRFPMEDLTQLPSKYSSWQKAILSSTYPIINMWPELYQDENYFDQTKISTNYPKYLKKKFISREYYAYRDWSNPNLPLYEKISKHVFGVSFINPQNKYSYVQKLIDAGYSPSEAQMEADAELRRHNSFTTNAIRAVGQAQVQAALPESQQDRPYTLESMGFFEKIFNGLDYAAYAGVSNVITLLQSGKMGDKGIRDRVSPSTIDKQLNLQRFFQPNQDIYFRKYTSNPEIRGMMENIGLSVYNKIGYLFGGGSAIIVNGETKLLTKEGRALARQKMPITLSGRAEGLYGKRGAMLVKAKEEANFLKYVADNPGFAERVVGSRFMQSAGIQFFGRTVVNQSHFVSAYRAATFPVRVSIRGVTFAGKTIGEVAEPLTDPVTKYIASKMYATEAQKLKWKDEITKNVQEHFIKTKELQRQAVDDVAHMKSQAEIKLGIWTSAKRAAKLDPTKGYFAHYTILSEKTAVKLTDFSELGKSSANAQGVVDDVAKEFNEMANELISRGIIKQSRLNYVSHITLSKYKILKGYTDPVISRLHLKSPFTMHREHDKRILEINAEMRGTYGVEVFEANIWKILKTAKPRHIEVVEDYDFLQRLIQEQGISKHWAHNWYLKSYGESSIPMLRNVLLPKETIRAIEEIPRFRNHIATVYTKPGIATKFMDDYNAFLSFYRRTIIGLNPGFVPRNLISSFHQNIQAGLYDITKYLPNRPKNGVAFVTQTGRPIYNWELQQAHQDYKIIGQPGMGAAGAPARREWNNAIDKIGDTNNRLTATVENWIRTHLFDQKVQQGMDFGEASAYVIAHHLDYTKKYSKSMELASKFIMFPTWSFNAPKMIAHSMVERPWQFALLPKTADLWNGPTDKMMLQYKPEYLSDRQMYKVPFTNDTFFALPLSTSELTQYPVIFKTKEFQFYWAEALANPNILKRFARSYLNIDWLSRGGGTAKVQGNYIILTYELTGERIIASTQGGKLRFTDDSNILIKEFETIGDGSKIKIVTEGEPLNELARKHLLPIYSVPVNALLGSTKYKLPNTGNPETDAFLTLVNIMGFGAIFNSIEAANDEDIPLYQAVGRVFGLGTFWNAHTAVGMEKPPEPTKTQDISKRQLQRGMRDLAGGRFHR